MQNITHVTAFPAFQERRVSRFQEHRKGSKFKLVGVFAVQPVIDMLQRAHTKARNIREHKIAAVVKVRVQPVGQHIMTEADAFVRNLGRVYAAESCKPVVGQRHTLAQIIGDHGGLAMVRGVVAGQGHHGRGLSGTEKAAEHDKFSHDSVSFSLIPAIKIMIDKAL